jgi:hypothetical protein
MLPPNSLMMFRQMDKPSPEPAPMRWVLKKRLENARQVLWCDASARVLYGGVNTLSFGPRAHRDGTDRAVVHRVRGIDQ